MARNSTPEPSEAARQVVSLSALTSPTAVKAAIAECDSLGRETFLETYGFKPAGEYRLHHAGSGYDSKAIAGVAYGYQYGTAPLHWNQFKGGRGNGCAGWSLDRLGFEVEGIKHVGWWIDEVDRAIHAYFDMYALYKNGEAFTKASFLRQLHDEHGERSYKAYEYKFQNISAVLDELGQKWISGYAPKRRYQQLLRFAVEDWLGRKPGRAEEIRVSEPPARAPRIVKIDWAKRDAENRALGTAGERFVYEAQRQALIDCGRPDLAARVKWDAREADGHGYDISSFEKDGTAIYIEVKTTTRSGDTAFFVSPNEVRASKHHADQYRLFRVSNLLIEPKVTVYVGDIEAALSLRPASFRATVK